MIDAIRFHNFRVLRSTTLPLSQVTVIIGPNGCGKSTVAHALEAARQAVLPTHPFSAPQQLQFTYERCVSFEPINPPEITLHVISESIPTAEKFVWNPSNAQSGPVVANGMRGSLFKELPGFRSFSLSPSQISRPVPLTQEMELAEDGGGLARVLTHLQDRSPENWSALNDDLRRWLPEFDRVLLKTTAQNQRSFLLRTTLGRHEIDADRLSDGTKLAVALLTLTHLPVPPSLVMLEEPDRGIHPRLLRDVQDAIYRLAFPSESGDRAPVQVIVTTHSPYLIDLFRDHPEQIVIAEKIDNAAIFRPLAEIKNLKELLEDSHLGAAWFSGALGGVPAGT